MVATLAGEQSDDDIVRVTWTRVEGGGEKHHGEFTSMEASFNGTFYTALIDSRSQTRVRLNILSAISHVGSVPHCQDGAVGVFDDAFGHSADACQTLRSQPADAPDDDEISTYLPRQLCDFYVRSAIPDGLVGGYASMRGQT